MRVLAGFFQIVCNCRHSVLIGFYDNIGLTGQFGGGNPAQENLRSVGGSGRLVFYFKLYRPGTGSDHASTKEHLKDTDPVQLLKKASRVLQCDLERVKNMRRPLPRKNT
jgi:hypothetical protein